MQTNVSTAANNQQQAEVKAAAAQETRDQSDAAADALEELTSGEAEVTQAAAQNATDQALLASGNDQPVLPDLSGLLNGYGPYSVRRQRPTRRRSTRLPPPTRPAIA